MRTVVAIVTCFLATLCLGAKLPFSFKRCDKNQIDFNECLAKAVENVVQHLDKPVKKFGIPSFEPLSIRNISVAPDGGVINFEQNYTYLNIYEFTKIHVKNFDLDLDRNLVRMECVFPELLYEFRFVFKGTVLAIPIDMTGLGRVLMVKPTYIVNFSLEDYVKNDKKYFKVVDGKMSMDAEKLIVKLEDLFDGDTETEARINKLFNDNWEIIFEQAKGNYEIILGRVFSSIFNNILTKVPAAELFGSD